MSYSDKVRELVGAPAAPVDEARIEGLTRDLDAALTRAGVTGAGLSERVHRWEADRAIDPAQLEQVFTELLAAAKARTDGSIFDTGDYEMRLNAVSDAPYTARCGFKERRMDLNVDNRFTRAAMKHLVCHEVFPGHATQLLYTLAEVQAGRSPADALLCTANAVTGCVQEGIGDQGVALIDWIEDEDDEIHMLLRPLKSAVQTTAAWRMMVQGEPREVVADYLRTAAFGQEAWVQGRLRMAEHPFRGPFIASYYAGNESVRQVRERVPAAGRGRVQRLPLRAGPQPRQPGHVLPLDREGVLMAGRPGAGQPGPGKLGVGLVGAHTWAEKAHLPGYAAHERVELAAICDVERDRAEAMAAKFGAGGGLHRRARPAGRP